MKLKEDLYFLQVEKQGFVDSLSIVAIRDSRGLTCLEIGGGGEKNIRQTLDLFERDGLSVSDIHTVVVSHTHADHMGAVAHFRARIPGTIVVDHEVDAPYLEDNRLLDRVFDVDLIPRYFPGKSMDVLEFYRAFCPISETRPDRTVKEGDVIECGPYSLEVVHTPGHHPGHISLFERSAGFLFVGDMLGLEVPFYTPRSGGATGFLRSMDKFRALKPALVIPSHGDLVREAEPAVEAAAGKVIRREARVEEALGQAPRTFREILPELFRNEGQHVFPGAAILASHLARLEELGRVRFEGDRYRPA